MMIINKLRENRRFELRILRPHKNMKVKVATNQAIREDESMGIMMRMIATQI